MGFLAITNLVDWMAELDVRPVLLLVGVALLVYVNWKLQRRMKRISEGMIRKGSAIEGPPTTAPDDAL
ncbi:hypothetical protein ACFL51_01760 [Myxococcota bacterium]